MTTRTSRTVRSAAGLALLFGLSAVPLVGASAGPAPTDSVPWAIHVAPGDTAPVVGLVTLRVFVPPADLGTTSDGTPNDEYQFALQCTPVPGHTYTGRAGGTTVDTFSTGAKYLRYDLPGSPVLPTWARGPSCRLQSILAPADRRVTLRTDDFPVANLRCVRVPAGWWGQSCEDANLEYFVTPATPAGLDRFFVTQKIAYLDVTPR